MITLCANTIFEKQIDYDDMFPIIPDGEDIFIAVSGGVESMLLLHLCAQRYTNHTLIPFTGILADRRRWEAQCAQTMIQSITPQLAHNHRIIDSGVGWLEFENIRNSYRNSDTTPEGFYSTENRTMLLTLSYMTSVDGVTPNNEKAYNSFTFTGKNWSTLDPENITKQQQAAFSQHALSSKILRPFLGLAKEHIISIFEQEGIYDKFIDTFSCINAVVSGVASETPQYYHCGECHACWDRQQSHAMLGKTDPTFYTTKHDAFTSGQRLEFNNHLTRRQESFL